MKKAVHSNWILVLSWVILLSLVFPIVYFYRVMGSAGIGSGLPDVSAPLDAKRRGTGLIGLSLNSLIEARWMQERDLFVADAEKMGWETVVRVAENDPERQVRQIASLLDGGIDVLVVVPVDQSTLRSVLLRAKQLGIPVVCYDNLTEGPVDLFVTFDYRAWGRLQAEALIESVPQGNLLVLRGPRDDYRAGEMAAGWEEAFAQASNGHNVRIEVVSKWSAAEALSKVRAVLADAPVDGVLAPTDVVAVELSTFFAAQSIDAPVTGGGAEIEALRRVVDGRMLMTVFQDYRDSVRSALKAAVALGSSDGQRTSSDPLREQTLGVTELQYRGRVVPSVFLPVTSVTKENAVQLIFEEERFYDWSVLRSWTQR